MDVLLGVRHHLDERVLHDILNVALVETVVLKSVERSSGEIVEVHRELQQPRASTSLPWLPNEPGKREMRWKDSAELEALS